MVNPNGIREFYHINHQRSTVAITADDVPVLDTFTYNAYGESGDALAGNHLRFAPGSSGLRGPIEAAVPRCSAIPVAGWMRRPGSFPIRTRPLSWSLPDSARPDGLEAVFHKGCYASNPTKAARSKLTGQVDEA